MDDILLDTSFFEDQDDFDFFCENFNPESLINSFDVSPIADISPVEETPPLNEEETPHLTGEEEETPHLTGEEEETPHLMGEEETPHLMGEEETPHLTGEEETPSTKENLSPKALHTQKLKDLLFCDETLPEEVLNLDESPQKKKCYVINDRYGFGQSLKETSKDKTVLPTAEKEKKNRKLYILEKSFRDGSDTPDSLKLEGVKMSTRMEQDETKSKDWVLRFFFKGEGKLFSKQRNELLKYFSEITESMYAVYYTPSNAMLIFLNFRREVYPIRFIMDYLFSRKIKGCDNDYYYPRKRDTDIPSFIRNRGWSPLSFQYVRIDNKKEYMNYVTSDQGNYTGDVYFKDDFTIILKKIYFNYGFFSRIISGDLGYKEKIIRDYCNEKKVLDDKKTVEWFSFPEDFDFFPLSYYSSLKIGTKRFSFYPSERILEDILEEVYVKLGEDRARENAIHRMIIIGIKASPESTLLKDTFTLRKSKIKKFNLPDVVTNFKSQINEKTKVIFFSNLGGEEKFSTTSKRINFWNYGDV